MFLRVVINSNNSSSMSIDTRSKCRDY